METYAQNQLEMSYKEKCKPHCVSSWYSHSNPMVANGFGTCQMLKKLLVAWARNYDFLQHQFAKHSG